MSVAQIIPILRTTSAFAYDGCVIAPYLPIREAPPAVIALPVFPLIDPKETVPALASA